MSWYPMPISVDHDARRAEVANLACRLIAEGGIESVTFRKLAEATGYSTSVITHYFADRHQLLLRSYAASAERAKERFAAAWANSEAGPLACLEALLPVTPESRRDWHVNFAFWQTASTNRALAAEQRRVMRYFEHSIRSVLQRTGKLSSKEAEEEASKLLTMIVGVAVQALFDVHGWPASRQRQVLGEQLKRLGF